MTGDLRNMNELWLVASLGAEGKLPSGGSFTVWGELAPREVASFQHAGLKPWPLPELSKDDTECLLAKYHHIIARIGLENGADSLWWYTWSSSRDRFHSRILGDLELTERFRQACGRGLPDRLVLFCPDPYLARALMKIAQRAGVPVRISAKDRFHWVRRRFQMKIGPLLKGIKTCGRAFIVKHRVRKIEISLQQVQQAGERTILATWVKAKNLAESGPATDTFFGQLPKYLVKPDHSVVVFGDLLDGLPPSQPKRKVDSLSPVVTMGSLLTNWAIISAFARAFMSRISIGQSLRSEETYLTPLIKRDIRISLDSIVYGLLMESALERLVKAVHPTQIIHMCENIPWERMCTRASNSVTPKPEVTGYMHCAVILAQTRIVLTDMESSVRPRPHKLICTGPNARDLMVRFGGHPPHEVVAGTALRHEYLASMKRRSSLNRPIHNILVVLEGLPNMSHLVRFVFDALDGNENYRTVIRPHPASKIEFILGEAGLSISDFQTIRISENPHIIKDFDDADLVVYKGSTAAIEAGYIGIPLVHFKHENLLTDDPLFEITDLKKVASGPEELIPAIEQFSQLDDGEFLRQFDLLRAYIDGYLTMPGQDCTSVFLPEPIAVPAID